MRQLVTLLQANTSRLAPEFGGLLLGSMESGGPVPQTHVDAFEPFSIEYRYGANYVLSRVDREKLEERIGRLARKRVAVVGWCRSHARRGLYLDQRDFELLQLHFQNPASAFLVVRSDGGGQARGGFFVWEEGDIRRHASYQEFPLAPEAVTAAPAPEPVTQLRADFNPRVTQGILSEVLGAQGGEAGGILLGRRNGEQILIEDFEPVLCEHRFGSSYQLSEEDVHGLEETLEWFRTGTAGLEVLGFYRSYMSAEGGPDKHDLELFDRHFASPESLWLRLKPEPSQTIGAQFFWRSQEALRAASEAAVFPPEGPFLLSRHLPAHRGVDTRPSGQPHVLPPPTRPRRNEEDALEDRPRRYRQWIAAAIVVAAGGGVLGYLSVRPQPPRPRAAIVQQTAARSPAPAVPVAERSQADRVAAPAPSEEVRAALERWRQTMRSGDPNAITEHYLPVVERYFTRRNASAIELRRSLAQSLARYGRPAILRLSDVRIMPLADGRATATFRKHWQTSGPRINAGESEERMELLKRQDVWKISSEQEVRVYWTHRGR